MATYTNLDRDAVNSAIFDQYTDEYGSKDPAGPVLQSACVVFMDDLQMQDVGKTFVSVASNQVKRWFYENVSESLADAGTPNNKKRIDPCLKLYTGCPMMMTENSDVANGEANGSRVTVKKLTMKYNEAPFVLRLANGTKVNAMFASQVKSITVEHEEESIVPRQCEIVAGQHMFRCKMNFEDEDLFARMKGNQFPLISNSCTTGHKLQGCTLEALLVNDSSWYYAANWAYVVLSRVKTMKGLFLRRKLLRNLKKYQKSEDMVRMIQKFRDTIAVKELDQQVYDDLIAEEQKVAEDAANNFG